MTVMQHDIQEHDMNELGQLAINMKSAPSVRKPVKKTEEQRMDQVSYLVKNTVFKLGV